jgi:hypothetical protein
MPFRELDASVGASGPHDFAVRDQHLSSACRGIAHKSFDQPCDPIARKTLPRPPHPVPYVRDDRETPLCVGRDAKNSRCDLGCVKTEIFLQRGLDSKFADLPVGQIAAHRIYGLQKIAED